MGMVDSAEYAELLALPVHLIGEIVGGTLYTPAKTSCRNTLAASALTWLLGASVQGGGGDRVSWWVLPSPELHLGGDVLVPDLAAWRRERMPEIPDEPFFDLPQTGSPKWSRPTPPRSISR